MEEREKKIMKEVSQCAIFVVAVVVVGYFFIKILERGVWNERCD